MNKSVWRGYLTIVLTVAREDLLDVADNHVVDNRSYGSGSSLQNAEAMFDSLFTSIETESTKLLDLLLLVCGCLAGEERKEKCIGRRKCVKNGLWWSHIKSLILFILIN